MSTHDILKATVSVHEVSRVFEVTAFNISTHRSQIAFCSLLRAPRVCMLAQLLLPYNLLYPSSALETCLPARFVRSDNPSCPSLCSRSLSFGTNAALKRPGLSRLDFIPLKTNVDSEVYRVTVDTTERRETLQLASQFSASNCRKVNLLLNTSRGRGILWSSSQSVFVVLGCAIPTSPCIDKP